MKEIAPLNSKRALIGTFMLCFFIAGIPFWQIPYADVSVPNSFFGVGVIVVFAAAAVLSFQFGFKKGLLSSGLLLPAVLMARVIVEAVIEPGRHNLWPLALIIVVVLGFIVGGAGAALGWLLARLVR